MNKKRKLTPGEVKETAGFMDNYFTAEIFLDGKHCIDLYARSREDAQSLVNSICALPELIEASTKALLHVSDPLNDHPNIKLALQLKEAIDKTNI